MIVVGLTLSTRAISLIPLPLRVISVICSLTSRKPEQPRDNLQQVMCRFWDAGGRMIDVSPLYGMSEVNVGEYARALGMTNGLFIANKIWATGEYLGDRSQAQRQLEQSMKRLSRNRIDAMQVHSLVNVEIFNL